MIGVMHCLPNGLLAQSLDRMVAQSLHRSEVTISRGDSVEALSLALQEKQPRLHLQLWYHWYGGSKVKVTQGGFNGRLLHGPYSLLTHEKDLLAEGNFYYGLKSDTWRYWFGSGHLRAVECWKKGLRHGPYQLFDQQVGLREQGVYRRGVRHGKVITFADSGRSVQRFRRGKLVSSNTKKQRAKPRAGKPDQPRRRQKRNLKADQSTGTVQPGSVPSGTVPSGTASPAVQPGTVQPGAELGTTQRQKAPRSGRKRRKDGNEGVQ